MKERILLHLLDNLRASQDYVAPFEITQDGIARAVWINVHHVSQYTRPPVEEILVAERVAHVQGGERRRKVYALTDKGRFAAAKLRDVLKSQKVKVRGEAEAARHRWAKSLRHHNC